jgi:hypothetical protein
MTRTRTHRISDQQIVAMQSWRPRRIQLATEWPASIEGNAWPGSTLRLVLPFRETLERAFRDMCGPRNARFERNGKHSWMLELKGRESGARRLARVQEWLATVGRYIAIRDWLDLSFALDYDREHGRLDAPRTRIGALRFRAKPLDDKATPEVLAAADELTAAALEFLKSVNCYEAADAVAAAPPARADQPYHLPGQLARGIAAGRGLENLSASIRTVRDRPDTKRRPLDAKLKNITGSVALDADVFKGRSVLLLDDIYQSGTSLNYLGKLLYEAGAAAVFGLVCEKTSRDDDNIQRPE